MEEEERAGTDVRSAWDRHNGEGDCIRGGGLCWGCGGGARVFWGQWDDGGGGAVAGAEVRSSWGRLGVCYMRSSR